MMRGSHQRIADGLKLEVFLWHEDHSRWMSQAWEYLTKKIVGHLESGYPTQQLSFRFEQNRDVRWASRPCNWSSRSAREQRRVTSFYRVLAALLLEEDCFVFFHFDGDCSFAEFARGRCENFHDRYEIQLLPRLRNAMAGMEEGKRRKAGVEIDDASIEEKVSQSLEKLIPFVPCYSIEAWLYQNHKTALAIIDEHFPGHADRAKFEEWGEFPERLDEIMQIKEQTCLGSQYNAELAKSFPFDKVYCVDKSFYESCLRAENCVPLREALKRTRGW